MSAGPADHGDDFPALFPVKSRVFVLEREWDYDLDAQGQEEQYLYVSCLGHILWKCIVRERACSLQSASVGAVSGRVGMGG